jgi:hypothetical protein
MSYSRASKSLGACCSSCAHGGSCLGDDALAFKTWYVVIDTKFSNMNAAVGATSQAQGEKLLELKREFPAPRYAIHMFASEAAQLAFLKGPKSAAAMATAVSTSGRVIPTRTYVLAAGVAVAAYLLWRRR